MLNSRKNINQMDQNDDKSYLKKLLKKSESCLQMPQYDDQTTKVSEQRIKKISIGLTNQTKDGFTKVS